MLVGAFMFSDFEKQRDREMDREAKEAGLLARSGGRSLEGVLHDFDFELFDSLELVSKRSVPAISTDDIVVFIHVDL